ncbi:hypothetical protein [Hydrogenoanaerobacterium saccharovorans]|uniref:hypothetical protein n=1 Tax=Hydrogenoanaerobacterium saccharovorans TaxID=474960 RepID=UPI0013BE903F|nr:hypothetical protein [Hydrogenoanaerobacterium saccharovorans]
MSDFKPGDQNTVDTTWAVYYRCALVCRICDILDMSGPGGTLRFLENAGSSGF